MGNVPGFDLDREIERWRFRLESSGGLLPDDVEELETHLRDEIRALASKGLSEDEALLIAVKRIGRTSELSREYFKVNSGRLWKHLLVGSPPAPRSNERAETWIAVACALLAAAATQIPYLFGRSYEGADSALLFREGSFYLFPFLVAYIAWKRSLSNKYIVIATLGLVAGFLIMNLYPYQSSGDTLFLSAAHLFLLYWTLFGLLYASIENARGRGYTDYLAFSGELLIYSVLIGLGGAVLTAITLMIFSSIGIELEPFVGQHAAIAGIFAVPVFAAYLVEAKRSVIENIAPVLAKIFVPLFFLATLAFLIAMTLTGTSPFVDRDLLIAFDLLLLIVLAMVFYSISSRDDSEQNRFLDIANFALLCVAAIVDIVALAAILFRLTAFGFSANKLAALGENVLLLAHLATLIVVYASHLFGRREFQRVERWVVLFIPVYAGWFAVVAVLFPIVFKFA